MIAYIFRFFEEKRAFQMLYKVAILPALTKLLCQLIESLPCRIPSGHAKGLKPHAGLLLPDL